MSLVNRPAEWPVTYLYDDDGWLGGEFRISDAQKVPVDLTAEWSDWRGQWRSSTGALDAIDLHIDDSDADQGIIRFSLMDKARMGRMGSDGGFDIEAVDQSGVPRTWVRGETKWERGYTR